MLLTALHHRFRDVVIPPDQLIARESRAQLTDALLRTAAGLSLLGLGCGELIYQMRRHATSYGTDTLRRTRAAVIYRRTKNLRPVQLPLGHTERTEA